MRLVRWVVLGAVTVWPIVAAGQSGENPAVNAASGTSSAASGTRGPALVLQGPGPAADSSTAHLLGKLHQANQMAIQAGRLAVQRGAAKAIHRFGELLIRDHGMAERMIAKYARRRGIHIPVPPTPIDDLERAEAKQQTEAMARLEILGGAPFDRAFATTMNTAHEMAMGMVDKARSTASDPTLRSLLGKILPIFEQDRNIARDLQAREPNT